MTKEQIQLKREKEKQNVEFMVKLYCKKKHKCKKQLCADCQALLDYSKLRTSKCPHMQTKTFCAFCKTPCYKPDMKQKMREVMRFSGPRTIFYHPISAIKHLKLQIKETKRVNKEQQNEN